jgi:hypothetical protein
MVARPSASQTIRRLITGYEYRIGKMWKEAVVAEFELQYRNLSERN